MMSLLINIVGLLVVLLIVYWFWLAKPKARVVAESLDVIVDGGIYTPALIEVKRGDHLVINFLRKDESPCAQYVLFPDLNISEELPVGKAKPITIPSSQPGEFEFTCQMGMYRGKLVIFS